ncbi:N-acetylmuramoyl-L-alanine amidase family protein [Aureivirga marina]|uniref:N-acetylmuramoyl-L-alanine amidase family protein n=1 Tax=Aureivirga marina TaxID=1182451 RepID=UPI0018C9EA25|nr:N-acetylmuramoyl-L-alanine amidase [Aureivirga marina]
MKKIVQKFILITLLIFSFTVQGQTKNLIVTARKGDGIYSLLRKHGLDPGKYYYAFIKLNKKSIGKKKQLFAGRKYKLPINKNAKKPVEKVKEKEDKNKIVMTYDIFGKKHKDVKLIDNKLEGAVYYLVSGHGGPDPGAIDKYKGKLLCEDEYAYDVTLRLARKLIQHGATVYLIVKDKNDGIRDDVILELDKDEVVHPNLKIPLHQGKRLKQRTDAINKLYKQNKKKFQRLLVLHVDSRSKRQNIDVFFYHYEGSNTGKSLATTLRNTFKRNYKKYQPKRSYEGTVSSRNLYMIKNTYPSMVYIELGNIRNSRDRKRIINPENREAMAKWIKEGVLEDYNKYKK